MSSYLKSGVCLEWQYKDILQTLLERKEERYVRNFETFELSPFVWVTDSPLKNILTNKIRKINHAFSVAEFLWMISGRDDVEMVSFYNKNISNFSDDGKTFYGAYGPRIKSQLSYILSCFKKDINTRQAVITIFDKNPPISKDIPCTLSFQFLQNNNKLNMIASMRSNDVWLGFPYDVYNFTMIQNYLAYLLGLEIGTYTHVVGSEHLYFRDIEKAKQACSFNTIIEDIKESIVFTKNQLSDTIIFEEKIRKKLIKNKDEFSYLSEPWKSMLLELFTYVKNKCIQKTNHVL